MSIVRQLVGEPEKYEGRTIEARFMGPDLLCHVDGVDLCTFYLTPAAAREGGRRYVDAILKAERDLAARSKAR